MNLQTEVKDNIIVFYDKSTKFITEETAKKIFALSAQDIKGFTFEDRYIGFGSISQILSTSDYYKQYPDRRPAENKNTPEVQKQLDQSSRILSPIKSQTKRKRALEQMIKGLKKYINSSENQGTGKPEKLLERMEARLQSI